jgi:hypothetical protein
MRSIGNLKLFTVNNYIDVGFITQYDDNNIFAIKQEYNMHDGTNDYILRIWGCADKNWLEKYGAECGMVSDDRYYGVIIKGVDEV